MKQKRFPIQNIVLRTLLITGVVGMALVAPNAMRLFAGLDRGKAHQKQLYRRIEQARWRLERKGLVRIVKKRIELTKEGREHVESIRADGYQIREPILWDGKWRIVIFDVREKRRKVRDALRRLLRNADFLRLQDSVWIYPYPCDEFVELVRSHLGSGVGEMIFLTADAFAGDSRLRREFSLSL